MFYADEGTFDTPSWYISGPHPGDAATQNGFTPDENRFLRITPACIMASSLFRAVWGGRRPHMHCHQLDMPTATRRFTFTGERFDQFDLDVLTACLAAGDSESGDGIVRVHMPDILATLDLRSRQDNRRRVHASLSRLEHARLSLEDARYRISFQMMQSLLYDRVDDTCIARVHPAVAGAFHNRPALRMFLRERVLLAPHGLARWLHAALWACGGSCGIARDRLLGLCAVPGEEARLDAELDAALSHLADVHLLHEFHDRGRVLVIKGNRHGAQRTRTVFFPAPHPQ
jgi:hypothetical protein